MRRVMNTKWYLLMFLAISWIMACEPAELPESIDPGPIFYGEMVIGGEKVYLGSGKDDIYNFSFFEAGPGNSIRLSSILQRDTCEYPCPSSFRVDIFGVDTWMGGKIDPVIQLKPGARNWQKPNETSIKWSVDANLVNANSATSNATIKWLFNGTELDDDDTELTDLVRDSMGSFELCAVITRDFKNFQRICHGIKQVTANPLEVRLNGLSEGNGQMKFSANAQFGRPPYNYYWNGVKGDREISTRIVRDTAHVALRVVDAGGNYVMINNVASRIDSTVFPLNAHMQLNVDRIIQPASLLGKSVIRWVDANGVEFSSALGEQRGISSFEIEEVQLFRVSPSEKPVAKVKLRFDGDLFSRSGNKLSIENGRATMVFRYPD